MARLIFVNRFFCPDHSATSQILSDLAFDLADAGREVHVVTRGPHGHGEGCPVDTQLEGFLDDDGLLAGHAAVTFDVQHRPALRPAPHHARAAEHA